MFVVSNRNIMLPSEDHKQVYALAKGFIGEIPDWAAKTEYFKALVKDGKIGTPASTKDKDVEPKVQKKASAKKVAEVNE